MLEIKLNIDVTERTVKVINDLVAAFTAGAAPAPAAVKPARKAPGKREVVKPTEGKTVEEKTVVEKPVGEKPVVEKPTEGPAQGGVAPLTFEKLRALAVPAMTKNKTACEKLLSDLGVKKLSAIPEDMRAQAAETFTAIAKG